MDEPQKSLAPSEFALALPADSRSFVRSFGLGYLSRTSNEDRKRPSTSSREGAGESRKEKKEAAASGETGNGKRRSKTRNEK